VTTFRADVRDGLKAMLDGFAAANTSYNLACYRYRPAAFGNRPLVYIASLDETINHTGTTIFQRTIDVQFAFVWASSAAPEEVADIRDDVIDAFVTYAMPRPSALSLQTRAVPARVQDVELELDGAFYPASIVSIEALAQEGTA
jgi:hypothetical protein